MSARAKAEGAGVVAAANPGRSAHYAANSQQYSGALPWILTRLLALLLLSGASGLLYHVATSDEFRVARVVVVGNRLVSASEIESIAAVYGANIFWVRQQEVQRRLQTLPAVNSVRVSAVLPNRLEIRIAERTPVAVWEAAGEQYLVDEAGQLLGAGPGPGDLTTIREVDASKPRPNADAIATAFRLQQLLPRVAGVAPRAFEYSQEAGISVVSDFGPRLRFGDGEDLDWKVYALAMVRRELERSGQRVELIDLRFKDRLYVR